MPAVFIGHGTPMNALERNRYSEAWSALGRDLPKPRAILAISAHWYIEGTAVTAMPWPRTIHDFGGFPDALHQFQYPAAGDPDLAERVRDLLAPLAVASDQEWGLDHGTWSVLTHLFPQADVPVVQLAIDRFQPNRFHYDLGRRLAALRQENVLILGSGNVVHNLRAVRWDKAATAYDWAQRFNELARTRMASGEAQSLIDYEVLPDARLAVPTPEHYLPLLYVLGTQGEGDAVSFPVDGIDLASIGMLSVKVSAPAD